LFGGPKDRAPLRKLRDDIGKVFTKGKQYFNEHFDITAAELYRYAQKLVQAYGARSLDIRLDTLHTSELREIKSLCNEFIQNIRRII